MPHYPEGLGMEEPVLVAGGLLLGSLEDVDVSPERRGSVRMGEHFPDHLHEGTYGGGTAGDARD
jgi:hypothetical protein